MGTEEDESLLPIENLHELEAKTLGGTWRQKLKEKRWGKL